MNAPKPIRPKDVEKVRCEMCLKEIPRSEAMSPEAQEYVLYFCGIDCYERWVAGGRKKRTPRERP